MEAKRRLAVIMFTDIVGYTSLMASDEREALSMLEKNRTIQRACIEDFRGEWLKEMGDGLLAAFESTSDALRCGTRIMREANLQDIQLRIGIHLGEVVFRDGDVFGDGVNIASRVESLAIPGSIFLTAKVYDDIRNKPEFKAVSQGAFTLKNIPEPVVLYALNAPGLRIPESSREHVGFSSGNGQPRSVRLYRYLIAGVVLITLILLFARQFLNVNVSDESTSVADGATPNGPITLAALPFSNVSRDADIDYLGFALVDEVISSLSYLKNVLVRPSSSIRKYSDDVVDPQEVGAALSVQYILMGHYVMNGDSVRLNLELIDVMKDVVLWRGAVQEPMSDIFKLQDLVANRVINGLEVEFSSKERDRMVEDTPRNPVAYEYYLRSLSMPYSVEGNRLALDLLAKAIELDSMFSPAYSETGNRLHFAANYGVMDTRYDQFEKARESIEHALTVNSESLAALGYLALLHTEVNEMNKALTAARKMLEVNPNNALAHFSLGYVYRYTGMIDEALKEMEIAVRIDPKDNQFRSIGITYNMAERYEDAIASLYYDDGSGFSESWRGITYIRMKEFDKARTELAEARVIDPESMLGKWCDFMLRYVNHDSLNANELSALHEFEATVEDPEAMYLWGLVNVMHQDYGGFLTLFEKAVDHGYFPYRHFQTDPILEPLKDNPDFQRVLEKSRRKHEDFKARYF